MPYVTISSYDDTYRVTPMSEASADARFQQGDEPILLEDGVYEAWTRHQQEHAVFCALFTALRNEQLAKLDKAK